MTPLYLTVTDKHIKYSYEDQNTTATIQQDYNINPKLPLTDNFVNFKSKLPEYFDVIVILNPIDVEMKDTIVSCKNQPIDIGLYMENLFHIPTVGIHQVAKLGLKQAASIEAEYAGWHLDYYGYEDGKTQYSQEAMQTLGNGYFGLRGAYVESKADKNNYPGTYVAGVYNQLTTSINSKDIVNEDLVNLPNAQYITFSIDDTEKFKLNGEELEDIYRSLDMRTGLLTTTMLLQLKNGKRLKVVSRKVADMKNYHSYSLQYTVQPLNFSGEMKIHTEIDGQVVNANVERYKNLDNHHLITDKTLNDDNTAILLAHTRHSKINIAVGSKLDSPNLSELNVHTDKAHDKVAQSVTFEVVEGNSYTLEKTVSVYTSLETKGDLVEAVKSHSYHKTFADAVNNSMECWQDIWSNEYLEIDGDITSQKLLHLNAFHATVSAQQNVNRDLDVSVGARGLHGEAYRGHVFWDELFILPYYNLHYPDLTKSLLMYRYNRLGAAKEYAKSTGNEGAMFPWQSGMTGDEQSQVMHLNPITNQWDPDNSRKQRHVSLSIAYNIWNYYSMTNDEDFIRDYGLEMLLNITKFWISMTTYNEETGKYSISNVMGPDEFHEGYPDKEDSGLTNNAYTNIMTSWVFKKVEYFSTHESQDILDDNYKRADFSKEDLKLTKKIRHNLELEFNKDEILAQFDGYFDLKPIDFDYYRRQYGDISRMDRILKAEGDNPDDYQVAKQADSLMALYALREPTFFHIMSDLGYEIPDKHDFITKNIEYYLSRTTHGSTLSRIVYAMLALKVNNNDLAWKLFSQALTSDYYDIQGGTTAEGIHLGVMGATLNVVTCFFAGIDYRGPELEIDPHVPDAWQSIKFNMSFKGTRFYFTVTHDQVRVIPDDDIVVVFKGDKVQLDAHKEKMLNY
ncbi:glycosyl hydrolase [Companilactobacillus nodensis DSM 19682 = JCM 14932 = NBRC 107160]|uniref:Glycosyl hydrolase n=2 Tax=Companilactobacillus nodensis TaxID=460870 RepID=A0A0R1K522_9LACO|nr:glycosyl hydrolase family 65 protein [Companilactobacillus nodensis]KRK78662.1 glycosyl hydrolase [Companilactobacillus nodensis DSM 19682 = JCM 14932 = NBRC 107160]